MAQSSPKREFRGTWIHTVGQDKYAGMSEKVMKTYFKTLLDSLRKVGINTVVFQVRPEADAWYRSSYEPWSRYITGEQGKNPGWDPLEFMVEECHKRNIDLHAWLNPYRVRTSSEKKLAANHLYYKNPWMFIQYGEYIWFDPGLPACRTHILNVVKDIVKRYDIDAIHMDDYFYPYPMNGLTFNDEKSFAEFGKKAGYTDANKADWRRDNVNTLIRDLYETIHSTKPWVKFGISPFGIYRNQKSGVNGSLTTGFTNYDGLYADILLWIQQGWIDYVIPQLYWEIGHKVADYETLIHWWAANNGNVPLYIGQDVVRTIKPDSLKKGQLNRKMLMAANVANVTGHCFWPAYELEKNSGGIIDSLRATYFRYLALHPADNNYDLLPPNETRKLSLTTLKGKKTLIWSAPEADPHEDKAVYYVVYGFKNTEKNDLENPKNILAIVRDRQFILPTKSDLRRYTVTAVDRSHNESMGTTIDLKSVKGL